MTQFPKTNTELISLVNKLIAYYCENTECEGIITLQDIRVKVGEHLQDRIAERIEHEVASIVENQLLVKDHFETVL